MEPLEAIVSLRDPAGHRWDGPTIAGTGTFEAKVEVVNAGFSAKISRETIDEAMRLSMLGGDLPDPVIRLGVGHWSYRTEVAKNQYHAIFHEHAEVPITWKDEDHRIRVEVFDDDSGLTVKTSEAIGLALLDLKEVMRLGGTVVLPAFGRVLAVKLRVTYLRALDTPPGSHCADLAERLCANRFKPDKVHRRFSLPTWTYARPLLPGERRSVFPHRIRPEECAEIRAVASRATARDDAVCYERVRYARD